MVWFEHDNIAGELSATLAQLASQEAHLLETQRTIGLLKSHAERLRKDLPADPLAPIQFGDPEPSVEFTFRYDYVSVKSGNTFYRGGGLWFTVNNTAVPSPWTGIPSDFFPLYPRLRD